VAEFTIPDDEIIITDPETLRVIANSLRLQIIKQLQQPATVKEVADAIDLPPTKLYYHFSQLEKQKLIRVVDTKVVSGIIEKHYQVAAKRYRVDEQLFATTEDAVEHIDSILGAIFDNAKTEIKHSIEAGLMQVGKEGPCEEGSIVQAIMYPTPRQLESFCDRLMPIIKECESWDSQDEEVSNQPYGLIMAFYPIIQSQKGGKDGG
jgi:DNA-binding transcriptional ArsR family regulator